jgi:NAD-dependent deacetylase
MSRYAQTVGTAARDGAAASRLAELIRQSRCTVALTGAGISVPSGIPDFRSPGTGIWENVDPMEVAHIDAFRSDPERFWKFYRPRFETLDDKQPNPAHSALAELEAQGLLDAVVTQNIDRLHRKAGSKRLIEVHGSIDTSSCTDCDQSYPLEQVDGLFTNGVAHCATCSGLVKPDVVLFGEFLPAEAIQQAQSLAERCDLLLCVGSSLEVYPVAGLPQIALASGAKLGIVTQGPTPYDSEAEVRLEGDVVDDMTAVLAAL